LSSALRTSRASGSTIYRRFASTSTNSPTLRNRWVTLASIGVCPYLLRPFNGIIRLSKTDIQAAGIIAYPFLRPALLLDEQLTKSKSKAEAASVEQPSGQKLISFEEVSKHNSEDDAWVIINVSSIPASLQSL
jgi:hypothetical protein